jgi:hypothetical protein
VAQQAMQVYYLPLECQKDPTLEGWYLAQLVSPHGKVPVLNNEDYNFDPNTYIGEFYQPEGLDGTFDIDMFSLMGMEVDNDIDEDDGEEVQNAKDLALLERLWFGVAIDDNDGDEAEMLDNIDSDDDTYDPAAADPEDYF